MDPRGGINLHLVLDRFRRGRSSRNLNAVKIYMPMSRGAVNLVDPYGLAGEAVAGILALRAVRLGLR